MRAFFQGQVPGICSIFGTHVWNALYRGFSDSPEPAGHSPESRPWEPGEFGHILVTNPDSQRRESWWGF